MILQWNSSPFSSIKLARTFVFRLYSFPMSAFGMWPQQLHLTAINGINFRQTVTVRHAPNWVVDYHVRQKCLQSKQAVTNFHR
jgi:hypothetical protein